MLKPLTLKVREDFLDERTYVDLSFQKTEEKKTGTQDTKEYSFTDMPGLGFIDSVFNICYKNFSEEYTSLKNISLVDVIVKPIFSVSTTPQGTDAKTDIFFRVKTKDHGISEFRSRSRSIIRAGLSAALEAFEFYINCDKAHKTLLFVLEDAKKRNRGDISQKCISDLSALSRVNTYV